MTTPRAVALAALLRVDSGAYANVVLPLLLERSGLDGRDRRFATELTYGTTRMRRACDWLVDTYLRGAVEPTVRALLRLGAYQLHFLGTPAHAALDATVGLAPRRARGLVNAVLRRLALDGGRPWPDLGTELSYPDWILSVLSDDLGREAALGALCEMNHPHAASPRADGYVQDEASRWVTDLVEAGPRARVADLCAAPGGKATSLARSARGGVVAASDLRPARAATVKRNARRLGISNLETVVADGRRSPYRPEAFDWVLLDAPCSGLGALRRRPDARWRVQPGGVRHLGDLQRQLLRAAASLLRPGGTLVYSVCTMTRAETVGLDRWAGETLPALRAWPPAGGAWAPLGRGGLVLPQDAGTNGMYVLRLASASA